MPDASRRFDLPPDHLAAWEIRAIHGAVRTFTTTHTVPALDRDDLTQEAIEAWLLRRSSFDSTRTPTPVALLNAVVNGRLTDLLRAALAQKRGGPGTTNPDADDEDEPRSSRTVSLALPLDADGRDGDTLADTLEGAIAGTDPQEATSGRLLADALARVAQKLAPAERELLTYKLQGLSAAQIARLLGEPPSTIRSRDALLREKLRHSELRDFLD